MKLKSDYFECVCNIPEHTLRFSRFVDKEDPVDWEIYVEIFLSSYYPWYRRAWIALLYVLNVKQKTGSFDGTVLDENTATRLALYLSPELQSLHKTKIEV